MMHLSVSDWIGFTGVVIMLVAYGLNLLGRLSKDGWPYIVMNIVGAGLSCLASIIIRYMPFVLLEAVWTLVSVGALVGYFRRPRQTGS